MKKLYTSAVIFFLIAVFSFLWSGYQFALYKESAEISEAVNLNESEAEDGDLVYITGKLHIDRFPVDDLTGVSFNGFYAVRTIEMYQYYIFDDIVLKSFCKEQYSDIKGRNGERYHNEPFPETYENAVFLSEVSIDGTPYKIDESFIYNLGKESYQYYKNEHKEINYNLMPEDVVIDGFTLYNYSFYSGNPLTPEIGDLKIKYDYVPVLGFDTVTILGVKDGNTIINSSSSYSFISDTVYTPDEIQVMIHHGSTTAAVVLLVLGLIELAIAFLLQFRKKIAFMKKILPLLVCTLIAFSFVSALSVNAKADFGDYGGDYDYGGYDSGGYDYGGYDSNDYGGNDNRHTETTTTKYYDYVSYFGEKRKADYVFYNIDSEVVEVKSINSGSSSDNADVFGGGMVVTFISGLIFYFKRRSKGGGPDDTPTKKPSYVPKNQGTVKTDSSTLKDVADFRKEDKYFDTEEFRSCISEMYVKFQHSWQKKDMKDLRPYLTDSFYNQCERQLSNYIRNNQTNVIENIKVDSVHISGWKEESENDVMIVVLKTRITDYVIDDKTGSVVRGDKKATKNMTYEWTLIRSKNSRNNKSNEEKVCPHCGAPITINAASECEYCGSIIETEASDWAVSNIKGLAQKTTY